MLQQLSQVLNPLRHLASAEYSALKSAPSESCILALAAQIALNKSRSVEHFVSAETVLKVPNKVLILYCSCNT